MDWEEMYGKKKSRLLDPSCFDNGYSDRLWLYSSKTVCHESTDLFLRWKKREK